jgi:hypothetical protein
MFPAHAKPVNTDLGRPSIVFLRYNDQLKNQFVSVQLPGLTESQDGINQLKGGGLRLG